MTLQGEVVRAIVHEIKGQLMPQTQARLSATRQVDPEALDILRHCRLGH